MEWGIRNEELLNPREKRQQYVPVQVVRRRTVGRYERLFLDAVPQDVYEQRDNLAAYFSSPEGEIRYVQGIISIYSHNYKLL